jgi:fatty acid-binding protein DegV
LAGASADAVFRLLEDGSALSDTYAVPGDLSFLERTGELASLSSQSSVGPIDGGTPVFRVRGRVSAAAATRDHSEAQATIVERVVNVAAGAPVVIVIAHAGADDHASELATAVEAQLAGCEVHVSELGPSIGAVLGPGSYALGFCAAQGC